MDSTLSPPPQIHASGSSDSLEFVRVKFLVRAKTGEGDVVGIIGSDNALGAWNTKGIVNLVTTPQDYPLWTVAVTLPASREIEYKYVIVSKEGSVEQWESLKGENRKIKPTGIEETVDDGDFGRSLNKKRLYIDEGWLSPESGVEIRMYLGLTSQPSVRFFKPHLEELSQKHGLNIRMSIINAQCEPYEKTFNVTLNRWLEDVEKQTYKAVKAAYKAEKRRRESVEVYAGESDDFIPEERESSVLTLRDEEADCYKQGDMVTFTTRAKALSSIVNFGLTIEFWSVKNYSDEETSVPPETLIGRAVVLSSMLGQFDPIHPEHRNSTSGNPDGVIVSPIFGPDMKCVGELWAKYLIITPFIHPNNNLSKLWRTYWRPGPALDIGHRGMGKTHTSDISFTKEVPENTIGSLISAAQVGADMVEFDVQLTKDFIPVLHHDVVRGLVVEKDTALYGDVTDAEDTISEDVKSRLHDEPDDGHYTEDTVQVDISQLTLKQWRQLKTRAISDTADAHPAVFKPLSSSGKLRKLLEQIPKLEDCFKAVPEHVGFNIEIKYPERRTDYANYFEKNFYVDTILKVIFDHAGTRRIVISTFDPDVCTLVRVKQPKYPVFFLTHGDNPDTPPFNDKRWYSTRYGVIFAKHERLLGVVHKSTTLIEQPSLIPSIKNEGLVVFTWGELNNIPENVALQKRLGVDAVIVDNLRGYMTGIGKSKSFYDLT